MSQAVLADAQFSVARVFRPFEGFETVYQDKSPRTPIAVPGNLDPDVGATGFDANLISGIPVPMGSKVMLWLPTIYQRTSEDPLELQVVPYRYQFIWRLRNLRDFRARRSAYHFPRQSLGANNEFVVPAAQKVVLFEGPNTTRNQGPAGQFSATSEVFSTHQGVLERLEFPSVTPVAPRTPADAAASYQQGVANFSGVEDNQTVTFNSIQMDAEGDELLIMIDRLDDEGFTSNWDFTDASSTDFGLSLFFGSGSGSIIRDLGIYVFTGSNP